MLDDNNAKEIEAALREEEELDTPDGMTLEEWKSVQAEAQAEEEFIADREDTVRPLVFEKKKAEGETDKEVDIDPTAHPGDALGGAIGSGDLQTEGFGEPINNEEELRKESVKEDNPFLNPDDAANDAPMDGAAESTADASADDSGFGGETAAEPMADAMTEPAAPVEEPAVTETPTPIPGGMPTTPVTTDAPAAAPAAEPKKKKKTGLIIGLAVLFVLIIGGVVGGICFYNWHESPEKQVNDAVTNIINAKTVGSTSQAAVSSGSIPSIQLSMSSEELLKGKSLSVGFGFKGADTIYLKAGGLNDLASGLLSSLSSGSESDPEGQELTNKIIEAVIKPIDNNWIAITIDDAEGQATLSCLNESYKSLNSDSFRKKMNDAFTKYPFIKYKEGTTIENRDGVNYYEVEIDEDLQKKFSSELENAEELKNIESCMTNFGLTSGTKKTGASLSTFSYDDDDDDDDWDDWDDDDDWGDWDDDDYEIDCVGGGDDTDCGGGSVGVFGTSAKTTNVIKLGIASWSHELKAMEVVSKDEDGKTIMTMNLSFNVMSESEVSSAKSIEDLKKEYEKSIKDIKDLMLDYIDTEAPAYCKQIQESYGKELFEEYYGSVDECARELKKEYEKELEDYDLNTILNGMGGMVTTSLRA